MDILIMYIHRRNGQKHTVKSIILDDFIQMVSYRYSFLRSLHRQQPIITRNKKSP